MVWACKSRMFVCNSSRCTVYFSLRTTWPSKRRTMASSRNHMGKIFIIMISVGWHLDALDVFLAHNTFIVMLVAASLLIVDVDAMFWAHSPSGWINRVNYLGITGIWVNKWAWIRCWCDHKRNNRWLRMLVATRENHGRAVRIIVWCICK